MTVREILARQETWRKLNADQKPQVILFSKRAGNAKQRRKAYRAFVRANSDPSNHIQTVKWDPFPSVTIF